MPIFVLIFGTNIRYVFRSSTRAEVSCRGFDCEFWCQKLLPLWNTEKQQSPAVSWN